MAQQGSYFGTSHDRYMAHNEHSTIHKMKETYWTTKQAVMKKLGKKEDEHVVASDAQLDAKLEVFQSVQKSSMDLLRAIEKYQDTICAQSQEENAMGRFLKTHSQTNKTRAGKMMAAVGKAQSFSSQQRLSLRVPLVRLYQEVETFRYRAITDTLLTINRMETARTEYRGALMWMKDASDELDPDTYKQLEKFRKVQAQVKKTKAKFDKLKLDTMQKIDLLAASRCNMYSHVLANYQTTLLHFWDKTSRTMTAVADSFKGYQYYEFNMLKELAEPTKRLADETGSQEPAERGSDATGDRHQDDSSSSEEESEEEEEESANHNGHSETLEAGPDLNHHGIHNLLDFDIPNGSMGPSLLDLPSNPTQQQLPLGNPSHQPQRGTSDFPSVPLAPGTFGTHRHKPLAVSSSDARGWNSRSSVQQATEQYNTPLCEEDSGGGEISNKSPSTDGKGAHDTSQRLCSSNSRSRRRKKVGFVGEEDDDDDELISLSTEETGEQLLGLGSQLQFNQDFNSLVTLGEGENSRYGGSLTNLLQAVDKEMEKSDKPVKKNDGSTTFIDFEEEDFEPEFDIEELKRRQDAEFDLTSLPTQKAVAQARRGQGQDLLSEDFVPDDSQKDDMTILNEIMNAPTIGGDDFSREWHAVFGATPMSTGNLFTPGEADQSQCATFMPSSLLDVDNHTEGATGAIMPSATTAAAAANATADKPTPQLTQGAVPKPKSKKQQADMSAWFNLFADLDPLANPDDVGKSIEQQNDAL